jgi:uncharacterized SAM-binding protein YcdF (DUF218 family)
MMALSKLVGVLLHPLCPVLLLLLLGLWVLWRGGSRRVAAAWVSAALMLTLFWGWEKPAMLALHTLESQASTMPPPAHTVGLVLLGGGTDGKKVVGPDLPIPMGQGAERLTETLVLSRKHPEWRIIFSGGGGNPSQDGSQGVSESELTLEWWRRLGEPLDRIRTETRSRNTLENARFSAELVGADIAKPWLLVTSAWHMPRAIRIFEANGWKVMPYPVDRRYNPHVSWTDYSLAHGLQIWHICLREWVGLMSLRWTLPPAQSAGPAAQKLSWGSR